MTFDYGAIWNNRDILIDGVFTTLLISLIAISLGIAIGLVVCLLRISKKRLLSWPAIIYIEVMRNIPLLILIFMMFYASAFLWHSFFRYDHWFYLPFSLWWCLFC